MNGFPFSNGEVVHVNPILFVLDFLFLLQTSVNTPFGAHEGKVRMPGHQVGHAVLRGKGSIRGSKGKEDLPIFPILGHALAAEPFPLTVVPIGELEAVGLFTKETKF